jgi:osmotically-inducible protein OsmY
VRCDATQQVAPAPFHTQGKHVNNKFLRRTATTLLLVAGAALVGCAATPRSESTAEYVDDTVITTRVKAAVLGEPTLKSAEINVETFKGRVQLSGFVNSQTDINRAVTVARAVPGVTSVANDMRLK